MSGKFLHKPTCAKYMRKNWQRDNIVKDFPAYLERKFSLNFVQILKNTLAKLEERSLCLIVYSDNHYLSALLPTR